MSKNIQDPAFDDAVVAEKVEALTDFCVNKLFFGLIPKTFVTTIFVLLFSFLGFPTRRISAITGFCEKTVRRKIKTMNSKGFEVVFARKTGVGRKSRTTSTLKKIEEDLDTHDYRCTRQIRHMLSTVFKIDLCLSSIRSFLKKLGYKFLRCGSLPAKADPVAQRKFYDEVLQPLMHKASQDECGLHFMDSHFIFGIGHMGSVWSKVRRFIKTFSGRKRWNVLGCMNFVTKEVLTVSNDTYITATQVIEMLQKVAENSDGKPQYVILDNAKYQHCAAVMDMAKKLVIELRFLPPYSPNLNLIERLWKYVKKELSTSYFTCFEEYKAEIAGILSETHTKRKGEMDTLIGEEVQLFDDLVQKSAISSELQKKDHSKETKSESKKEESV